MNSAEIDHITTLVSRCKKGDKPAQYQIYLEYADAMFNICKRFVSNHADAEDLLQDAFVKAFTGLHKLKSNRNFGGWLKKITVHECLNYLKKKKIVFDEIQDISGEIPETGDEQIKIDNEALNKAIAGLPEGSRIIFNLYLIEDYKHKEITRMLGISVSTSKSQYARAKRLLKKKLLKNDVR